MEGLLREPRDEITTGVLLGVYQAVGTTATIEALHVVGRLLRKTTSTVEHGTGGWPTWSKDPDQIEVTNEKIVWSAGSGGTVTYGFGEFLAPDRVRCQIAVYDRFGAVVLAEVVDVVRARRGKRP